MGTSTSERSTDDRPVPAPALLRVAPVLRRHFGIVTAAQCAEAGLPPGSVARLVASGHLERVFPGVYRCPLTEDTWEGRLLAASHAAGPQAVVGRWAAARLLGLTRSAGSTDIDLLVPRGVRPRSTGPTVRTSTRLRDTDVTSVGRFRCTDVAWTLADLAASGVGPRIENVVARAIAEEHCTLGELERLAERFRDVTGVGWIRALLPAGRQVVVGTRSRYEARFVQLVVADGLPRPLLNLRVTDVERSIRYLDAAWPDLLVSVEIDVHPIHHDAVGRSLDARRQNALVPEWSVLRFDDRDLDHHPERVVTTVRRALVAAGWRPEVANV
jgi:hypothetical protein